MLVYITKPAAFEGLDPEMKIRWKGTGQLRGTAALRLKTILGFFIDPQPIWDG